MKQRATTRHFFTLAFACRLIGFAIYAVAFLLPACRDAASQSTATQGAFVGWLCAYFTLIAAFSPKSYISEAVLTALAGWINPRTLLYLGLSSR